MEYTITVMTTEEEMHGRAYVHWKAWHETYAGMISSDYLENHTLEKCIKIAHRNAGKTFIAKKAELVIGFVGCGSMRGETNADTGEIYGIYVLKEYQKQKIGFALLRTAIRELSDFPKIVLWVLKDNIKAIGFYQRCGFRFTGKEKVETLGKPVTELQMVYTRHNASSASFRSK